MNEDFLHYAWKYRLFDQENLVSCQGHSLELIDTGRLNSDSGPDFFESRIKIDNLLTIFPGVSWRNKKEGVLQVNLKVAKYMVKPIFHLLGYRNKQIDGSHLNLFNRERTSKKNMYKNLFNQST